MNKILIFCLMFFYSISFSQKVIYKTDNTFININDIDTLVLIVNRGDAIQQVDYDVWFETQTPFMLFINKRPNIVKIYQVVDTIQEITYLSKNQISDKWSIYFDVTFQAKLQFESKSEIIDIWDRKRTIVGLVYKYGEWETYNHGEIDDFLINFTTQEEFSSMSKN